MNNIPSEGSIRGRNVVAGVEVQDGGTMNLNYGAAPLAPVKPFNMTPFPPDPRFIKRPAISKRIKEIVAGQGRGAALVGLGGVGKSQLAIQHAHKVRRKSPSTFVFWVHASSPERFRKAYQDIAERLQLTDRNDPKQDVLQLVYRWLTNEESGPWLLILDNADDKNTLSYPVDLASNTTLASYIPKTGKGFILVTSRNERVAERIVGDEALLPVPAMEDGQAKDLLQAKVGSDLYDDAAADSLVRELDRMPLAIVQAASFIKRRRRRGETIASYVKKFRSSKEEKSGLLATDVLDLRRDESASKTVLAAWQITFNQVRHERKSAAELLFFTSFFHPQGIPDFVLQAFYDEHGRGGLEDDIEVLTGYALISAAAEGHTLEMHALVQFCTQAWLSSFDTVERWRCIYIHVMSVQYPMGFYFENWETCRKLQPHVKRAIETRPVERVHIWNWFILLKRVAGFHYHTGEAREAEPLMRMIMESSRKILGDKDTHTLRSMSELAMVLLDLRDLEEAEKISREARDARIALGAEDQAGQADMLSSQAHLASVLTVRGKFEEAERISRETFEARRELLGKAHHDTVVSKSNLALVLWNLNQFEEAEELQKEVLEVKMKVPGEEHYDTLTCMYNLARTHSATANHEKAEELLRQALNGRTRILGSNNPDTLTTMRYLAETCWARQNWSEALLLLWRCARLRMSKIGPRYPNMEEMVKTLIEWEVENMRILAG